MGPPFSCGKSFSCLIPSLSEENLSFVWRHWGKQKKAITFYWCVYPYLYTLRCLKPIACVSETNENVFDDVRGPARKTCWTIFFSSISIHIFILVGKVLRWKAPFSSRVYQRLERKQSSSVNKKSVKSVRVEIVQIVSYEKLALLQRFFISFVGKAHEEEKFSRSPYRVFFHYRFLLILLLKHSIKTFVNGTATS